MRLGGDFVQKRNGKWLILGGLRKKCTTPCMPVDGPISPHVSPDLEWQALVSILQENPFRERFYAG